MLNSTAPGHYFVGWRGPDEGQRSDVRTWLNLLHSQHIPSQALPGWILHPYKLSSGLTSEIDPPTRSPSVGSSRFFAEVALRLDWLFAVGADPLPRFRLPFLGAEDGVGALPALFVLLFVPVPCCSSSYNLSRRLAWAASDLSYACFQNAVLSRCP